MMKALAAFMMALLILGGFYFIPSGEAGSEPSDSPLFAISLEESKNLISNVESASPVTDQRNNGGSDFITCEVTCGPTCNQVTCGLTCVATCEATCTNTCSQPTCGPTCVATCEETCANTCSQLTCAATCVVTCSYTCSTTPIIMFSFSAYSGCDHVVLNWTTVSEFDTYGFVIRRSTDPGGEFIEIAEVLSQSTGTGTAQYACSDYGVQPGITYYYTLSEVKLSGGEELYSDMVSVKVVMAATFRLLQNYPNPFNPTTTIGFELPAPSKTVLAVYDVNGQRVATLVDGWCEAGLHQVNFDGSDLASGLYIYRLQAGEFTATGKMMLVK
jgi:hypothetical protein